jgi:hypothetical protein
MNPALMSHRIEVESAEQALETFYQNGWTDGLPVVPPTEEKVLAFLGAAGLAPDEILGAIPERNRIFTAEKVVVNAVMAGCLPEYFPVVVAAVRGISRPEFGLHGISASTAGTAILMVVNGPVAEAIGLNNGQNLMGPGNRANATIGRALRLVLYNLGGREFDRSTLGHPGKYTYCIGEQETGSWAPLHVMRGFKKETSAVTLFAAEGPNQIQNHVALNPENILNTIADRMRALGSFNMGGDCECAVIICPEHYETIVREGWTKEGVREFLYENACRPLADLKRGGLNESPLEPGDEKQMVRAVSSPEHILLIMAGGGAGRFSACMPGWFSRHMSRAVTEPIGATCAGGT